jgi:hypothetical protein
LGKGIGMKIKKKMIKKLKIMKIKKKLKIKMKIIF